MSKQPIPDTTVRAIQAIAAETGLEEQVVRQVVEAFVGKIYGCLKAEIPFAVRGLCRFYHGYYDRTRGPVSEYYRDKVHREVKIKLMPDAAATLNGWVHDLGIKTNEKKELLKIQVRPDEIEKMRRRRVLEDQRSLGFRSELLFEESPPGDASLESRFGDEPSVEEIAARIGINLGE